MTETQPRTAETQARTDFYRYIFAFIILLAFFGGLLTLLITQWNNPAIRQIVTEQIRVFVLLPAAGLFSIVIVALFQATSGNIKFEILTVKFEGAAGPIVMWIFCFLSILLGIQ